MRSERLLLVLSNKLEHRVYVWRLSLVPEMSYDAMIYLAYRRTLVKLLQCDVGHTLCWHAESRAAP